MKTFSYTTKYSQEDNCFLARSIKFPSVTTHGQTLNEAIEELRTVVEKFENWLQEEQT